VKSSFVVVKLPIEIQYFSGHSSLTSKLVRLLVRSSFAALEGLEYSDYYFMKSLGGFANLDCRCWSMDCSWEDNCSFPHSLLAPNLQMNTNDKS
jgi:hypothetical protein